MRGKGGNVELAQNIKVIS